MVSGVANNSFAYRSGVFPLNRPDRIGAVAALHGVAVKEIEKCRVLELGCGDGLTLLSIAHSMPSSECVGVDLLPERIDEANSYAKEIGLENVSFRALDLMDLAPDDFGQFDFIIAHGLYSWVPEAVSERLLLIYREFLKPRGLGLISYNTFPGWHLRNLVRDSMLFGSDPMMEPAARADSALEFVDLLSRSISNGTPYQTVLAKEAVEAAKKERPVLFYDEMAEVNHPCLFQTFVSRLEKAGLRYVAEIEPRLPRGLPLEAEKKLEALEYDAIRREQFIDFLLCTRFRNSIVCRAENETSANTLPDALEDLFLTCSATPPTDASLANGAEVAFTLADGSAFSTNHAMTKSMLGFLNRRRPGRVSFSEIRSHLALEFPELGNAEFEEELSQTKQFAAELFRSNILEAGCFQPAMAEAISDRPCAFEFARWQAERGWNYVTNVYGKSFQLENDLIRALIVCLDGSNAVVEIPENIVGLIQVSKQDQDRLQGMLPGLIDQGLEQLWRMALLVE